ncbi:S-methyl-5'-thioadenosine phosphorylase [Exaiptasia diaphana]|nr:S-methyl-5'-thioadenosine phosphorylase [Exaiptasia diaphana]
MSAGKVKIGIIGGTGIDNPDIFEDRQEKKVETPFGDPASSPIMTRTFLRSARDSNFPLQLNKAIKITPNLSNKLAIFSSEL